MICRNCGASFTPADRPCASCGADPLGLQNESIRRSILVDLLDVFQLAIRCHVRATGGRHWWLWMLPHTRRRLLRERDRLCAEADALVRGLSRDPTHRPRPLLELILEADSRARG